MLKERWTTIDAARLRREALIPEVRLAEVDVTACETSAKRAAGGLALIAKDVGGLRDKIGLRATASPR